MINALGAVLDLKIWIIFANLVSFFGCKSQLQRIRGVSVCFFATCTVKECTVKEGMYGRNGIDNSPSGDFSNPVAYRV